MKKIICRKCGSEIDASLGECPVCGAVYYILSDSGENEPQAGNRPQAPDTSGSGGTHTWTIDDILNESTAEFGLDTSAYGQTGRQDAGQSGYASPENFTPARGEQYTGYNNQYNQQNNQYTQSSPQYTQQNNQYTQPNSQYNRQDDQYTERSPQQYDNNQYTQQNGQNPQYTQNPRGNQQNAQYNRQNQNPQQRDDRYSQQGNQNAQRPRQQGGQNPQRPRQQGGQNSQRQQQHRQGQRPGQNTQQRSRRELMDDDTAYYGQERRGGMSDRTKMLIVGAAAALALLTVIIFIMSGVFSFGDEGETQYMPDLVGLTETSAKNILDSYNLSLKVSTTYEDSSEAKDIVIEQSVKKGKKLAKKDSIVLVLSNGRGEEEPEESDKPTDEPEEDEKIPVPDLSGKTYQEAERELDRLGLKISKTAGVYDDNVPEGSVVTQSPVKGGELKKGGTVIVTLSNGPQPTEAPKNHIITVTPGKGGSISPKGQVEVTDGGTQSFSIIPDDGYEIREVKVDGTNVGAVESYTFTNVTGDHSIYAVFQTAATPSPSPSPTPSPTPDPTPSPTPEPPPPTEPAFEPDDTESE